MVKETSEIERRRDGRRREEIETFPESSSSAGWAVRVLSRGGPGVSRGSLASVTYGACLSSLTLWFLSTFRASSVTRSASLPTCSARSSAAPTCAAPSFPRRAPVASTAPRGVRPGPSSSADREARADDAAPAGTAPAAVIFPGVVAASSGADDAATGGRPRARSFAATASPARARGVVVVVRPRGGCSLGASRRRRRGRPRTGARASRRGRRGGSAARTRRARASRSRGGARPRPSGAGARRRGRRARGGSGRRAPRASGSWASPSPRRRTDEPRSACCPWRGGGGSVGTRRIATGSGGSRARGGVRRPARRPRGAM